VIRGLDNVDKSIRTLAYYMQLAPAFSFTKRSSTAKRYMKFRVIWERYVTARELFVRNVLKAAAGEWKKARLERQNLKRSWMMAIDERAKADARRTKAKAAPASIFVDIRSFLIIVSTLAALTAAASFCQRLP
jgi:RNase P/RNase MRP subunit POP5